MSDEFKSIKKIERMERRQNKDRKELIDFLKNTFIMLCIAVVAGGVLGLVYEVTKEPIATMAAKEKQAANRRVFLTASDFSDSCFDKAELLEKNLEVVNADFEHYDADVTDCIKAFDESGVLLGYVMEVTAHGGYGGDIVFQIGVCNDGTVNGISITSISETAGLGMRADEVLVPQFKNKNAYSFEVTKTGAVMENQIDAISSATRTSKAVTEGVNCSLEFFRKYLTGGTDNDD